MRHFNTDITGILEAVDLDKGLRPTRTVSPQDQKLIVQTVQQYREGQLRKKKAARILRLTATETKESKPLAVVADFVDILNRSTRTGNVVNAGALRKLAQSLGVKKGALDQLKEEDRLLAIQLIQDDYKTEAGRDRHGQTKPAGFLARP